VEVAATPDRYPPDIEAAAYFVACEGLANAVKHAQAERIGLHVARPDSRLTVSVTDDGMGGADADAGSGLLGLSDRVAAHGGKLHIDSVRGRGTRITAELPCASGSSRSTKLSRARAPPTAETFTSTGFGGGALGSPRSCHARRDRRGPGTAPGGARPAVRRRR